jgi:hypothetical protein
MKSTTTTVRIEIDGRWSALDMAEFLTDLSLLYDIRAGLTLGDRRFQKELHWWVREWRYGPRRRRPRSEPWPWPPFRPHAEPLQIERIRYASPGLVDVAGVGKVIEELRHFLEKLIDLRAKRKREGLENEVIEEEIKAKRIENARNFIRLVGEARTLDVGEDDVDALLDTINHVEIRLMNAIERGKITAIGAAPTPPPNEPPLAV